MPSIQPIAADLYPWIVGIDTHAATHSYAILETATGRVAGEQTFPTHAKGLTRAVTWIARRTGADPATVLISAECTGSYGALIAQRLQDAGHRVTEAPTPRRAGGPKTDPIDALAAATAAGATPADRLRDWRAGQVGQALQILATAREQINGQRTATINALTGLLRRYDLGIDARKRLTRAQITTVAGWRTHPSDGLAEATARAEAVRLATRIGALETERADNEQQMTRLATSVAPELLDLYGVGPASAAVILAAWSYPGRIRTEAAFAALAGTAPIPASSGKTIRYRVNHGGDRRLNAALYRIVITRARGDQTTRDYIERRTRQGLSPKEIRRCLKRYLARSIWRLLNRTHPAPTQAPVAA